MSLWSLARVFSLRNVTFQARNCCHPRAQAPRRHGVLLQCVAVCCSVLQCVEVCCSVLQCPLEIAVNLTPGHLGNTMCCCNVLQCASVGCSTLQCVAVSKIAVLLAPRHPGNTVCCCSVLQHVAVSPAHSGAVLIGHACFADALHLRSAARTSASATSDWRQRVSRDQMSKVRPSKRQWNLGLVLLGVRNSWMRQ